VVLIIKKAVEEATLAKDCLNGVVNKEIDEDN
jgi:hypothetical protein